MSYYTVGPEEFLLRIINMLLLDPPPVDVFTRYGLDCQSSKNHRILGEIEYQGVWSILKTVVARDLMILDALLPVYNWTGYDCVHTRKRRL